MKGRKDGISPVTINQGVAELGHELGNVLNGLLGMTRLVRDSGLNAEQERWLRAIEHSGRQMRWLVDAFWHGPINPEEAIHPEPVDLDGIELLEQAVLAHAPAAQDNFDRLLLAADGDLPRYWRCDPRLLRQILDNLLGNALKFTRSGEVVLEVAEYSGGQFPRDTLCLAVVDSGPGIDPALGRRMFDAHERGSDRARGGSGGHGLGLFICRRIVRAMGGTIGWSNPDAGGARFEVCLPGVLKARPAGKTRLSTGILRSIECQLDLKGTLLRSVSGCLARLGVAWRRPGQFSASVTDETTSRCDSGQVAERLRVSISELPRSGQHPGPQILLRAETASGHLVCDKPLQAPILECSLGPVLLELGLRWFWFRDEKPGSVP